MAEMDMKEKLVELLNKANSACVGTDCFEGCKFYAENDCLYKLMADVMITHGVTVQEWIPVTERLPVTIPCGAGTAYSEAVNVLTTGRKVLTAIWNGLYWICDAEFWDAEFEEITHWTPVLLPLPEPPKGE